MKINYLFYSVFILFFLLSNISFAQEKTVEDSFDEIQSIEGLAIYPNPVSNGKLYISTSLNQAKTVNIYDVLGKKILSKSMIGTELDISQLAPGVYILKVTENEISSTRKLVVR